MKLKLTLALAGLLLAGLFSGCAEKKTYWNPAETFVALDSSGQPSKQIFSLANLPPETEVVIVNFFAPHCPPCLQELPDLARFYQEFAKNSPSIQFVAVGSSLDAVGDGADMSLAQIAPQVEEFRRQQKMEYPVYLADSNRLKSYRVSGFPETFILRRDHQNHWFVKRRFISAIKFEELLQYSHNP